MKTNYAFTCCFVIPLLIIFFGCNTQMDKNADSLNSSPNNTTLSSMVNKQEEAVVDKIEEVKKVKTVNKIVKHDIVTDSLGELKANVSFNDRVIDSLNAIAPLYDTSSYNHLSVSYFSTLADSLHGKPYFAMNSDEVVLSIMTVLTTRLNEETDIVFLIDKTASMDDDIEKVKGSLKLIMNYLKNYKQVKVGMAFYGDNNHHFNLWYDRMDLTNNIDDVNAFMNTYSTISNPDVAESVNDAIVKTVEEMNWTKGNKRLMLVIGDAQSQVPPYARHNQSQVIRKCDSMNVKFNLYPIIIASKQTNVEKINERKEFMSVYPNPVTDYCNLKFNSVGEYFYEFADMTGKIIYNSKTSSLLEIVSGTNFVNGTYLLQVYNFDFSKYYSKMIIIQH